MFLLLMTKTSDYSLLQWLLESNENNFAEMATKCFVIGFFSAENHTDFI